ncbi:MAG: hypothetical protein KY476_23730, partial [Planctomycetes bacterium]|nr:hypothetical protein [Planctomycetota bacterium]
MTVDFSTSRTIGVCCWALWLAAISGLSAAEPRGAGWTAVETRQRDWSHSAASYRSGYRPVPQTAPAWDSGVRPAAMHWPAALDGTAAEVLRQENNRSPVLHDPPVDRGMPAPMWQGAIPSAWTTAASDPCRNGDCAGGWFDGN